MDGEAVEHRRVGVARDGRPEQYRDARARLLIACRLEAAECRPERDRDVLIGDAGPQGARLVDLDHQLLAARPPVVLDVPGAGGRAQPRLDAGDGVEQRLLVTPRQAYLHGRRERRADLQGPERDAEIWETLTTERQDARDEVLGNRGAARCVQDRERVPRAARFPYLPHVEARSAVADEGDPVGHPFGTVRGAAGVGRQDHAGTGRRSIAGRAQLAGHEAVDRFGHRDGPLDGRPGRQVVLRREDRLVRRRKKDPRHQPETLHRSQEDNGERDKRHRAMTQPRQQQCPIDAVEPAIVDFPG